MTKEYFIRWIKAAGVRAMKTMAQTMIGILPVAATITDVSWPHVIGTAALAGVTSLIMSIAGLPELSDGEVDNEE